MHARHANVRVHARGCPLPLPLPLPLGLCRYMYTSSDMCVPLLMNATAAAFVPSPGSAAGLKITKLSPPASFWPRPNVTDLGDDSKQHGWFDAQCGQVRRGHAHVHTPSMRTRKSIPPSGRPWQPAPREACVHMCGLLPTHVCCNAAAWMDGCGFRRLVYCTGTAGRSQ